MCVTVVAAAAVAAVFGETLETMYFNCISSWREWSPLQQCLSVCLVCGAGDWRRRGRFGWVVANWPQPHPLLLLLLLQPSTWTTTMADEKKNANQKTQFRNKIQILSLMCSNNVFSVNAGNASKNCAATSDLYECVHEIAGKKGRHDSRFLNQWYRSREDRIIRYIFLYLTIREVQPAKLQKMSHSPTYFFA